MSHKPSDIRQIYLTLTLFNTLATSFIWGINTLFLLDAGLNNFEAFAANAFFTIGQVLFEVPTGIIADTWGRRTSYMLGTVTLSLSTLMYLWCWQTHAPFWAWAVSSILLGLGFTFFSGATEAWLVDALEATQFKGTLESVMAQGQVVGGMAMLAGVVVGGVVAQRISLGVPYILRAGALVINFLIAFLFMKDLGFQPKRTQHPLKDMKQILVTSLEYGWKDQAIRWMMLAALFTTGVSFYTFYAMQPFLLKLYGQSNAYSIAGLAAAIVAGAQIVGGLVVPYLQRFFKRRTTIVLFSTAASLALLILMGVITNFWLAVVLFVVWGLLFAAEMPVRQAYLNGLIPSHQRATVLSFDSLLSSGGAAVTQPILGKSADVWSYSTSFLLGAVIKFFALPLLLFAKQQNAKSDLLKQHSVLCLKK